MYCPGQRYVLDSRDGARKIAEATQRVDVAEACVLSAMTIDRNLSRETRREDSAVILFAAVESTTTPATFDWAEQLMNDTDYQWDVTIDVAVLVVSAWCSTA